MTKAVFYHAGCNVCVDAEQQRAPVVVAVAVEGDQVGPRWGRAPRVAVAVVVDGGVAHWSERAVGWDVAHDEGTEGSHHARVVRTAGGLQAGHHGAEQRGRYGEVVQRRFGGAQRLLKDCGIATTADGKVWVSDSTSNTLLLFQPPE